jgi:hypothetical protein
MPVWGLYSKTGSPFLSQLKIRFIEATCSIIALTETCRSFGCEGLLLLSLCTFYRDVRQKARENCFGLKM